MSDPIKRWLTGLVDDAKPPTSPSFDVVRRRAERDRHQSHLAVAASVVAVAGIAVGAWALTPHDREPGPTSNTSPAATTTTQRPEPTLDTGDPYPSGLVVRLPESDVTLPADTSCWGEPASCRRGLLHPDTTGPDLGTQDALSFWFARPGWAFTATFRRVDDACPRATTVEAVSADGGKWFTLEPADRAGRYLVTLDGQGPRGATSTRFIWTTTSDGRVDPPAGRVGLFPQSGGRGTYSVEVSVDDLPFQPTPNEVSPIADVVITAASGQRTTARAPLVAESTQCDHQLANRGSFYFALVDEPIANATGPDLANTPVDVEVTFEVRGTTYAGRTTWTGSRDSGYTELTFAPPLPTGD